MQVEDPSASVLFVILKSFDVIADIQIRIQLDIFACFGIDNIFGKT
ncbi:hypothetical protein KR100_10420 [Synechococcus sp. KORDI-100]|nr:hypothetical protein KR100_10420 [Synechococcus sp. KORDI-100]